MRQRGCLSKADLLDDRSSGRAHAADSDEMACLMTVASVGSDENPDRMKTL
jgi:hypothetical protein